MHDDARRRFVSPAPAPAPAPFSLFSHPLLPGAPTPTPAAATGPHSQYSLFPQTPGWWEQWFASVHTGADASAAGRFNPLDAPIGPQRRHAQLGEHPTDVGAGPRRGRSRAAQGVTRAQPLERNVNHVTLDPSAQPAPERKKKKGAGDGARKINTLLKYSPDQAGQLLTTANRMGLSEGAAIAAYDAAMPGRAGHGSGGSGDAQHPKTNRQLRAATATAVQTLRSVTSSTRTPVSSGQRHSEEQERKAAETKAKQLAEKKQKKHENWKKR